MQHALWGKNREWGIPRLCANAHQFISERHEVFSHYSHFYVVFMSSLCRHSQCPIRQLDLYTMCGICGAGCCISLHNANSDIAYRIVVCESHSLFGE